MAGTIAFWVLLGLTGFAFALAIQMRVIIGVVIARALRARDDSLPIADSRLAVVKAGNGETGEAEIDHIHATYPAQVRQLRLARRVSIVTPILIVLIIAAGRFFGKV